jgi:fluoride ion exporter CrcB/FEX
MEQFLEIINEGLKKFSPYILGGVIGAIVHRLREKEMSWKDFFASILISTFVALCVGIICKDYFEIKQDTIIFVATGISGAFSKDILNEIQELIREISIIVKSKFTKE